MASVAKLRLQIGIRKPRNTRKTTHCEKIRNPERSKTAWAAATMLSGTAAAGPVHGSATRVSARALEYSSKVGPVRRGERQWYISQPLRPGVGLAAATMPTQAVVTASSSKAIQTIWCD